MTNSDKANVGVTVLIFYSWAMAFYFGFDIGWDYGRKDGLTTEACECKEEE